VEKLIKERRAFIVFFYVFFTLSIVIIVATTVLTYLEIMRPDLDQTTIASSLVIIGVIKLIFFDFTMLALFLRENWKIKKV
jgi:hypothetical protein